MEDSILTLVAAVDQGRIMCDELMQAAEKLKTSGETTLAWRSLQMSKAWLGKTKEALGAATPYKVVSDVKEIPATAEKFTGVVELTDDKLANINSIRQKISELINFIEHSVLSAHSLKQVEYSLQHLAEARMWYGFELQNMREV